MKDAEIKKENIFKKIIFNDKFAVMVFLYGIFCLVYAILEY